MIDAIKTRLEAACNATVSCADILAVAARDGVALVSHCLLFVEILIAQFNFACKYMCAFEKKLIIIIHISMYSLIFFFLMQLGGPTWTVPLGRRDARTASQSAANSQIPGPSSSLATLISMFAAKGLTAQDMTVLSGGHAIGFARCAAFRNRIYNDTNIDPAFATTRRTTCPATGGDANLAPLDQTPNRFDNSYYQNLVNRRGLLHSDQELFNGGSQDATVRGYSTNPASFARDFAAAMVKMGNISPLTGTDGEIRRNCRVVN